jgi:NAD(P)-dependent dehydrogenase (short-subunit alcohol dehydrogenase family)
MPQVVITGASQGIGAAIAVAFAAEPDARLVLAARNRANLERVALRCQRLGARTLIHPCDVTDAGAVEALAEASSRAFGVPDVLVNNAGAFSAATFSETCLADLHAQLNVNLVSAFLVTKSFLGPMLTRGRGTIFFLGSIASIQGYPRGAAYAAAKHGLLGLARTLREETKSAGLRVTTVFPGATLTPSWDGFDAPAERLMPAEDLARTIVDIHNLSPRSVVEEILLRPQRGDL